MKKQAVALGNFDGMHIGHIAVLNRTLQISNSHFDPCVLLFREHSEMALSGKAPPMLMTDADRESLILGKGLSPVYVDFNELKDMSPEEFVDLILIKRINAGAVVCGYNYRFGKNALGSSEILRELCKKRGIVCEIVNEVDICGEAVSSTRIRKLIEIGEIKRANTMLGRCFGFSSEVIHGDQRGRSWGYPTINQELPKGYVLPKFGVYASVVTIDGRKYRGITNIGSRPTVGTDCILSETHIFDYNEDIYGKVVEICLTDFVRSEVKFDSLEQLSAQIKADAEKVKGCEADV